MAGCVQEGPERVRVGHEWGFDVRPVHTPAIKQHTSSPHCQRYQAHTVDFIFSLICPTYSNLSVSTSKLIYALTRSTHSDFVVQFAKALGASQIIITSSSTSKPQNAINVLRTNTDVSTTESPTATTEVHGINFVEAPEWEKRVTGGEGVDIVVDVSWVLG